MAIFEYFYRVIARFIECYNVDFFGLGFTWLQFIISVSLIGIVLTFLFQGLNIIDKFNFSQIIGLGVLSMRSNSKEGHNAREQQMLRDWYSSGKTYPPAGMVDMWGDGTLVVPKEDSTSYTYSLSSLLSDLNEHNKNNNDN